MIKINLLTEVKQAQRKKGRAGGGDAGFNMNTGLIVLFVVLGLGWCGYRFFSLSSAKARLNEEIAKAEAEKSRLDKILEEVATFEKKKANLEKKIALINDLKRNQRGPVRMMDELSRMVPDLLWLDNLDYVGDHLTVKGRALSLNSVATFIDNIKSDRAYFSEPVLKDISQSGGPAFSFELGFDFTSPEKRAAEAAAAASGSAAPPPASR